MFKKFDHIENADLSNFSTMRTGGKAKYIVFPKNSKELIKIIKIIKKNNFNYHIFGNGSNILFSDDGYDGVLINLKHFNSISIYGEMVYVGAGVNLFYLNQFLQKNGLSGIEWSYGIPATIGGLVAGNGGCFGHEICDYIDEVIILRDEKVITLTRNEITFNYRSCDLKGKCIILNVKLKLKFENHDVIKSKMLNFLEEKREKQPCEFPSLGSVFKRVITEEIIYPAKLIDNLGLKGVKIGGAEVSKKHAGFIVNCGNATSKDVLDLIKFLEEKLSKIGVNVEREIEIL